MLNQTVIVDIFNKNWYNTINLLYVFNKINLRRAVRLNNKRLGGKNEKSVLVFLQAAETVPDLTQPSEALQRHAMK